MSFLFQVKRKTVGVYILVGQRLSLTSQLDRAMRELQINDTDINEFISSGDIRSRHDLRDGYLYNWLYLIIVLYLSVSLIICCVKNRMPYKIREMYLDHEWIKQII